MDKKEITINNENNKDITSNKIRIRDLGKINDFLYFQLDNGQVILANENEIYDLSEYNRIFGIFTMGEKLIAVLSKGNTLFVIDLKTNETLLEDDRAYDAYKVDDITLNVTMKLGEGNTKIYDIETKKYLSAPNDYTFEKALGDNLYVYRTNEKSETKEYDYKYCIINSVGKVLLEDIDGSIFLNDNKLIIKEVDKIKIINLAEKENIKIVEENDTVIAPPIYYEDLILIIEKDSLKLYTLDFKLEKEILLEGVEEILSYELVGDTLKLYVPDTAEDNDYGKHLFVNLKKGKYISHLRIEGFPYWNPKTYVGRDSFEPKNINFYFYDKNFNKILETVANNYECLDSVKENIFEIKSNDKIEILNASTGYIRELNYDYFDFHGTLPYGFGIDLSNNTMEFFDEDFNIVIKDFDYEKYDITLGRFRFFIINDYLCVIKEFTDGYGQTRYRTIIEKNGGEEILDSYTKQCYPMGNYIQIMGRNKTKFLNTLTGEIGPINLIAPTDEKGLIDLTKIKDITKNLIVEGKTQLLEDKTIEKSDSKQKKNRSKKIKIMSKH